MFLQDWAGALDNSSATSKTQTGNATTPGSTLFLDVYVRNSSSHPTVTVTDDGGNTWELLASVDNGSTNLYMFICRDAASTTSVSASWSGSSPANIYLCEFSEVGALIAATTRADEGTPDPITVTEGALLRGVLGLNVADRTFEMVATGVPAPDVRVGWRGALMEVVRADAYATTDGPAAIGWNRTAGNPGSAGIINVAFTAGEAPPPAPTPFLHRVDSDGVTPILLGVVTTTGVDLG